MTSCLPRLTVLRYLLSSRGQTGGGRFGGYQARRVAELVVRPAGLARRPGALGRGSEGLLVRSVGSPAR